MWPSTARHWQSWRSTTSDFLIKLLYGYFFAEQDFLKNNDNSSKDTYYEDDTNEEQTYAHDEFDIPDETYLEAEQRYI